MIIILVVVSIALYQMLLYLLSSAGNRESCVVLVLFLVPNCYLFEATSTSSMCTSTKQ